MTKKAGRNDKCPCGSGEKYKKCCLDSDAAVRYVKTTQPKTIFSTYNSTDLLKTISALTLLPENHGKNVRLELLAESTLKNFNSNPAVITKDDLVKSLNKSYSNHHLEDQAVNLFTDLITYYGGDYLILPGITEGGNYVLSNLLTAIHNWPNSNIPEEYKHNCMLAALFVLNISNWILEKAGLQRYQSGESEDNYLYVPDEQKLLELKSAVTFSKEEIKSILEDYGSPNQVLAAFTLNLSDPGIGDKSLEFSPILIKPLVQIGDEVIVISPATLSFALTEFLWSHAKTWKCLDQVKGAYHNLIWNDTQLYLDRLGFTSVDADVLNEDPLLPIKEGLYKFDADKLAYVQYLLDFSESATVGDNAIEERKQYVIDSLQADPEFANCGLLDLTLKSLTGSFSMFFLSRSEGSRSLFMQADELEIITELNETDAIDLWKFTIARDEKLDKLPPIGTSFLDLFKIYKEKGDSFYLSDDTPNLIPIIEPGYSVEMVQQAKLLTDKHSASRFYNGRIIMVPVQRKDEYGPIYYSKMDLGQKLLFLVEAYFQPIWIRPNKELSAIKPEAQSIYFEMADAVAYWIWQTAEFINGDVKEIGELPLTITFDLIPEEKFCSIERNFERDPNVADKFIIATSDNGFNIVIPSEINPHLYGADNEGERILLKQLLLGFNELLVANSKAPISDEKLNSVVDQAAPLGLKKKVFILDSAVNLLIDPTNLDEYRYVQEYDVNKVLDSIVSGLGDKCPKVGEITSKSDKENLTRDIVVRVLLPMLSNAVNRYNAEFLLQKLLGLNEALINRGEDLRIKTPTRIACFVSVEQEAKDLREELSKLSRTKLAVRGLIEHVAAEPPAGNKEVSTTELDELIAIMDQIITWGSLGDQIKFDLFNVKMSVLPSGRIGTEKSSQSEVFDPYYESKTAEGIKDSIGTFEQIFPKSLERSGKSIPSNLDHSFKEEFGISFTRICEFMNDLGIAAYNQSTPFGCMTKSELFVEVNSHDFTFTQEEFEYAINFLTLFNRGKVHKVPKGFESYDISPWRFNRRLSLLRRPLVAVNNIKDANNPIFYWGFRQVLVSRMYYQEQIQSGRFKCEEGGPVLSVIGKIVQERGISLVLSVLEKVNAGEDKIIDSELFIGPKHPLKNDTDIGDIDVLIIDKSSKTIYSLECKAMASSRNIKEMVEEVAKLFGSDTEKGWIQKHVIRHEWIENNLEQLGTRYKIDLTGFAVKSFMVTREDMLTPYLQNRKSDLPFITLYSLKEKGMAALLN